MTAFPSYSTGTVAIGTAATSIVGSGTVWSGVNAMPGDTFVVAGNPPVKISDVVDATHLAIDAWPFTAVTAGTSYKIYKDSPLRFAGGQAMADVSTLVGALNTDGFYVFVSSSLSVPDPSYGNDNQFAFQPSTSKLWLKTGGSWVLQGIFKGFNIHGAWSSITAYAVNDVVSLSGSSYVCILANTNQTPPNATYWTLLASIGATGSTGATGPGYGGSSTTSLLIANSVTKVFTTQAGLAYQVGNYVRASSAANGNNFMEGLVSAYAGTSLSIAVTKIGGTGTFADWNFSVSGIPGSGNGDMLAANNLSDVASKITSIDNLSVKGADIASAATLNLDTATGNFVHVTGTTGITAITLSSGRQRTVYFVSALTITASGTLVLQNGAATLAVEAGSIAVFVADGTTVRLSDYVPASQLAAANINGAVSYAGSQSLTTGQQLQARNNIALSGEVVGMGMATYASNASSSATIPLDDTIPQSSEGVQILSLSYTPKLSTSTLLVMFNGQVFTGANDNFVAALFNGGSGAFAAEMFGVLTSRTGIQVVGSYAPGSTTAQTISVRGGSGSASWSFNGSGSRFLGGASVATLLVFEIR
jgi:hypothetical protein